MAVIASNLTSGSSDSDASSYVTASISPSANNLILVAVSSGFGGNPNVPTLSGAGMTWVEIANVNYDPSGTQRTLTLFRSLNASPGSGALTIDFGGQTQARANWIVDEVSGVDTSGTNGSGAVVQSATSSATGSPTNLTVTLGAFSDAGNGTYGTFGWNNNTSTATPGTGFTELVEVNNAGEDLSIQSQWRNDNDTTVDVTLSASAGEIGGIAIEMKAAAAAAGIRSMRQLVGVGQGTR